MLCTDENTRKNVDISLFLITKMHCKCTFWVCFRKEEHTLGKIPLTLYCTGIATKENGMLPEEKRSYFYSYEFEKDGYNIWIHFITKGLNNESAVAFQKKIMSTLELSESFKRTDQ